MQLLITISLLAVLGVILFQDLRQRQISAILIPVLLIILTAREANNGGKWKSILENAAFNAGFILVQLLLLFIYFSLKNKKITNIIDSYIGLGDVLFFLCIAVAFSPVNFVAFYITASLFSLGSVITYSLCSGKPVSEIPLAGLFSVLMMIMILGTFNINDDTFIINLINA